MRRAVVGLCLVVAACGGGATEVASDGVVTTTAVPTERAAPTGDRPPPVVVRAGDVELELQPWTFCFGALCADGAPPDEPPSIGSPEEIEVEFPLDGWSFEASFASPGAECGRQETALLERRSPSTHRLTPLGAAGDHVVTLFGRGNGDLFVTFRWTTPVDGPYTAPTATATVVADHDGEPDSYGVELGASHLASTPRDASATIEVASSGGGSTTLALRRVESPCDDGSVRFDAPIEDGKAAAQLGDPPFTYAVTLVLDGVEHRASSTWPDDVDPECSPCVVLRFDPPLPERRG